MAPPTSTPPLFDMSQATPIEQPAVNPTPDQPTPKPLFDMSQAQPIAATKTTAPAPESLWGKASDLADHIVDTMPGIGSSRQIAKAVEDWTAKKQQELQAAGGFKSPTLTGVTNYALGTTHDTANLYRTLTQPSSLAIAGAAHVPILGTAVGAGLTAQGVKGMAESWGDLVAPNQPGQDDTLV